VKAPRNTLQRQLILEALREFEFHPTVEEVYLRVNKKYPTISKGTVYRNLRQLAEQGDIGAANLPNEQGRYENRSSRHYHFKCSNCNAIFDVNMEYVNDIDSLAEENNDFQIEEHDIVFKGICAECSTK